MRFTWCLVPVFEQGEDWEVVRKFPTGYGDTPEEAIADIRRKLEEQSADLARQNDALRDAVKNVRL